MFVGPLEAEEYLSRDWHSNLAEINFLRGSVHGYEQRVKELEEKFGLALEYQREKDARIVENCSDIQRTVGGADEIPTIRHTTYMESLPELIRNTPVDG